MTARVIRLFAKLRVTMTVLFKLLILRYYLLTKTQPPRFVRDENFFPIVKCELRIVLSMY